MIRNKKIIVIKEIHKIYKNILCKEKKPYQLRHLENIYANFAFVMTEVYADHNENLELTKAISGNEILEKLHTTKLKTHTSLQKIAVKNKGTFAAQSSRN